MNGSGYGGLLLLFLGIGFIFVATTAKGKAVLQILFTGGIPSQEIPKQQPSTLGDGKSQIGSPSSVDLWSQWYYQQTSK